MISTKSGFNPDYARPSPGNILKHVLDDTGVKIVDFAKRCGRPTKTISEIIGGHTAVTPETALQFERVLGIGADVWLDLEASFRLQEARARERADDQAQAARNWANYFPIPEMVRLGFFESAPKTGDKVDAILRAFGVSSVKAWVECWDKRINLAWFKQREDHKINPYGVAVWLRKGEIVANDIETVPYQEAAFKALLPKLRTLTTQPWSEISNTLIDECAKVGVAVALVPFVPNTGLRGAAYWAKKDKAVIVLSDQLKSEERIWFSFFHEAAHILHHSKKTVFIDQKDAGTSARSIEQEADEFSAETIIPEGEIDALLENHGPDMSHLEASEIEAIAGHIGVSPGLLIARLQFVDAIPYKTSLRSLFRKVQFT